MAAVAGSKGRIALDIGSAPKQSFQALLAGRLMEGAMSAEDVVQALLDAKRLREVGIDTNMICNLSCRYCYLDDRPEAKGLIRPWEWNTYLQALVEAGTKLVAFIGKEPLADAIALDTIDLLNERRPLGREFRIGMVTNGTFIDKRIDRLASAKLDYLDVSLDSVEEVNDQMRGDGVFKRVLGNISLYLATKPSHDFSVTSVLHHDSVSRYTEFVDTLFSTGIKTAFGSPILRFTERDIPSNSITTVAELRKLFDQILAYLDRLPEQQQDGRQVIIDLPYKYSWLMLAHAGLDWADIYQDAYEAHFLRPVQRLPLFIKFNFFPMSYWRAIRVTHDGRVTENMDLAAHRSYDEHSRHCADHAGRWFFGEHHNYHTQFLLDFVRQHSNFADISKHLYDREVPKQFQHLSRGVHEYAHA